MSADSAIALVACGLCLGSVALADEEQAPDAEFLEYLGMWDESDEDWMVFDTMQAADDTTDDDERSDPVPEGEESAERKDES